MSRYALSSARLVFCQPDDPDYAAVPTVPVDGSLEHTTDHPCCVDPTCPCHEDASLIVELDGLLTPDEATGMVNGRNL